MNHTKFEVHVEEGKSIREIIANLGYSQSALARLMKELGDDRDEKAILRSIQRMVAGDSRVSGEMHAFLGSLTRIPKPFVFTLNPDEIAELKSAAGTGGHQSLLRRLTTELERGSEVTFTDEQLGELIRYMTLYGSGGFQSRLRQAFRRSLGDLLRMRPL
jgi:hypothetical protein